MTESLFSNNTSNRFKFIMIPTFVAETEQLLYLHETKDCRQHALVTRAKWALSRSGSTVVSRFANRYTF